MGRGHSLLPNHREQNGDTPPLRSDTGGPNIDALMEENAELRKLVIQLSELVIKNVMNHR